MLINTRRSLVACGIIAAAVTAAVPVEAKQKPTVKARDIATTAASTKDFKTLTAAIKAADLTKTLQGPGPFTVFAPTEAAFAALPAGTLESLLKPENKAKLAAVLTYHVVPGRVAASQVVKLNAAKTVNGQSVTIKVTGGKVAVNSANVVKTDIRASNGLIHVIDKVLLPQESPAASPTADIVDTAVSAGTFKTLAAALQAAGLVETLKGAGPFTVFAPTDAAFAALPAGTLDSLLKPENKATLASILTYHVVAGKVPASEVVKVTSAKTVAGPSVKVRVVGSTVYVDDAKVTTADITASNGIIHVIDKVILPPAG